MTIGRKALPWFGEKDYRHNELLLCAFIAGNVRSQLDSGVNANDSYSGLIQVFRVYRYLKKKVRNYSIPGVEDLLKLHKDGKLMEYLLDEKEQQTHREQRPQIASCWLSAAEWLITARRNGVRDCIFRRDHRRPLRPRGNTVCAACLQHGRIVV